MNKVPRLETFLVEAPREAGTRRATFAPRAALRSPLVHLQDEPTVDVAHGEGHVRWGVETVQRAVVQAHEQRTAAGQELDDVDVAALGREVQRRYMYCDVPPGRPHRDD